MVRSYEMRIVSIRNVECGFPSGGEKICKAESQIRNPMVGCLIEIGATDLRSGFEYGK